ncbi:hypothetical protein ED328_09530 [Muribaculaceae bacterium Isolate-001 (NCI)]|nr:hypothetical protein EEL53_01990 [Muribaculaceae bacterium Isolate-114 (HZI)]RXE67915.1 hypothetical protein ED328_09530 [Muribaculaceae bacterium Isolate-001 (NCI)]
MSTGAGGAGAGQTLCAAGCRVVCCPRAAVSAASLPSASCETWQGTQRGECPSASEHLQTEQRRGMALAAGSAMETKMR